MEPVYFTVAQEQTWEQKIERSRFIGHAAPVADADEAQAFIGRIKTEVHPQATHNCFAYRIGLGENPVTYYSDHGEPSGTAGRPILNAILQQELTNTVVVVTRYFGGKKLGVRGLIDAYHSTALQTLLAAGRRPFRPTFTLTLTLPYPQLPVVNRLLQTYEGKLVKEEYGAVVSLTVHVPESNRAALTGALQGLSAVKWAEGH
ncbi:MAG TPA: YigZ family protein [Firmicutes bacterium]|uniref:YigZ family protein n=1 Tax=Capillibacterium thermochitinicola TaxID=2699427 RepID=A0A8J6HWK5_9FIRM|nr:YigZ family protein [Capillibacterium thermochitinicola]MBA2132582.1 YigZ family protein [Capillibacterium thermochitinicola]HHW11860.1 YigZ family protein [Bacillota bacterium]